MAERNVSAIASEEPRPIDAEHALIDTEVPVADPTGHDIRVDVRAVSVNPVDIKVRKSFKPESHPKILGFDAAGVVESIGPDVTLFKPGDEVFYAGSVGRDGSNQELHLVDERVVGQKPKSLDFAEAAALPLTTITAWESLFEKFRCTTTTNGSLLVLAGAGGVGSILIQLARQLTDLRVIATASRPESIKWCEQLGAHNVVNHHDLVESVQAVAPEGVDFIFTPYSAGQVEAFAKILKVRGEVVAIDDPDNLDVRPLKSKSQTWHWELMFARPLYDPASTYQHELLNEAARLVDAGTLRTTLTKRLAGINATNMTEAHRLIESSAMVGKVVLER